MEFVFSHPQYLFFLLAIPLLFFIHFLSFGNKKKKALKFANFSAIARIEGVDFFSKNLFVLALNILVVVLIVFSLGGLTMQTTRESSSFSFVIAIDSSQSMSATDFSPSRIAVAKDVSVDFVDSSPLDVPMGVVSFSGSSRIESDLTDRKDEIKSAINAIELGNYGGTDLLEAVLTASNLLKNEGSKAIIVLSDGQINVGNVDQAIEYANDNDVVVHTIGMGTLSGGETDYGFSKLDEDSLKSLSYNTQGVYFNAENKVELDGSFSQMFQVTKRKVSIELIDYLLLFAIFLVVLEFFLTNTRYINLI